MSEILILSEPEFMGEFPVRKDLEITPRSAQYGDNGECLHINKCWYTLAEAAYYGFFYLRSCADCKFLLHPDGKEILSRQHFLVMLAATDCIKEQADILLKAFEEINGNEVDDGKNALAALDAETEAG